MPDLTEAPERPPIWTRCLLYDDYLCNVHEVHAHECGCPDVETFALLGIDPYTTPTPRPLEGL